MLRRRCVSVHCLAAVTHAKKERGRPFVVHLSLLRTAGARRLGSRVCTQRCSPCCCCCCYERRSLAAFTVRNRRDSRPVLGMALSPPAPLATCGGGGVAAAAPTTPPPLLLPPVPPRPVPLLLLPLPLLSGTCRYLFCSFAHMPSSSSSVGAGRRVSGCSLACPNMCEGGSNLYSCCINAVRRPHLHSTREQLAAPGGEAAACARRCPPRPPTRFKRFVNHDRGVSGAPVRRAPPQHRLPGGPVAGDVGLQPFFSQQRGIAGRGQGAGGREGRRHTCVSRTSHLGWPCTAGGGWLATTGQGPPAPSSAPRAGNSRVCPL